MWISMEHMGQWTNPYNGQDMSEITKICAEHPNCVDCPLRDGTMSIQGNAVTCHTREFTEKG